jgi:hypothetical protein
MLDQKDEFRVLFIAEVDARNEDVQPYHSLWHSRPMSNFSTHSVRYPSAYLFSSVQERQGDHAKFG